MKLLTKIKDWYRGYSDNDIKGMIKLIDDKDKFLKMNDGEFKSYIVLHKNKRLNKTI